MEKIIVSKDVSDQLEKLILILYKEEYFGFVDSATDYVDSIIDFIFNSIGIYLKKNSPKKLNQYGKLYLVFKMNSTTSWYIFFDFDKKKKIYLVKAILNNHSREMKFLNI